MLLRIRVMKIFTVLNLRFKFAKKKILLKKHFEKTFENIHR